MTNNLDYEQKLTAVPESDFYKVGKRETKNTESIESKDKELDFELKNISEKKSEFVAREKAKSNIESKDSDGIEILVEMAKKGKIDAWNIDIVDTTDKYLQEIIELKSSNLRLTGRTLFFAALLLRIKSDILELINNPEEQMDEFEEFDDFEADYEEEIDTSNVISINDALVRRTSVRLNRKRTVTLDDLIKQLEFYEKLEKKRSLKNAHERQRDRRVRSYANFTADDIIDLAHDEYIEDGVEKLHTILTKLFETGERFNMKELNETGMDRISTYIALLFLSARSRIDLVQDEFYSDVYVVSEDDDTQEAMAG